MSPYTESVYFFLFVLHMTDSLASYYISEGKSVWSDQSKQCRFATPEIDSCLDNRDECSLKIDNDIGMQASDDSIWIGYYKTDMAFEYIGCVAENKIPEGQKCSTDDIDKDPRRCYPECIGSNFIGLAKDKKCCCFDIPLTWNDSDLLHSNCDAVCEKPVKVACGGEHRKKTYMSLYKINPNVKIGELSTESTEEGNYANCLKRNLLGGTSEWESCEESHGAICSSGNSTEYLPNKRGKWVDTAKQCFKKTKYPIPYSTASSLEKIGEKSVWTGVFKMEIIYKLCQETSSGYMNSDILYGHLTKQHNSNFYLHFTRENNSKRVLCEKGPVDTTTSRPVDTTTSRPVDTTTSRPVDTTTSNTGVVAIVSVAVVFVIIVVVVTVVLIHRRYISSQRFNKMQEASETAVEPEYNYPEFHYNRHEGENESAGAEYNYPIFSVQEARNNLHCAGTAGNSPPETGIELVEQAKHVYNQSENEGAYNVIGRRQKVVHGKAYDQAAPFQKSGTSASDDITYDISMSSGVKLKISHEGPTDNVYNTKNEIYNRIGDEAEKRGGKTDNLYGTKQMEKYKCILKSASDQNDQTYNSTSENCEECGVTDNPYSKLDTQ